MNLENGKLGSYISDHVGNNFSMTRTSKMVASTETSSSSAMETEEPTERQLELRQLQKMAKALHKDLTMMGIQVMHGDKLNQEEAELLRDIGNLVFVTLHQTALGQMSKKLKQRLSVLELMEQMYPLQLTVADLKKANRKKLTEAKRLKRRSPSKETDKDE